MTPDYTKMIVYRRRWNMLDKDHPLNSEYVWIAYVGRTTVDEIMAATRRLIAGGSTASEAVTNLEKLIEAHQEHEREKAKERT